MSGNGSGDGRSPALLRRLAERCPGALGLDRDDERSGEASGVAAWQGVYGAGSHLVTNLMSWVPEPPPSRTAP